MNTDKNIHSGHRQRVIENYLFNPSSFADHQVLELLLFFVLPRVDTNPLAHKLINTFGSLSGVFNASAEQLLAVKGVGEKVASFLVAMGNTFSRIKDENEEVPTLSSPSTIKEYLGKFLSDKKQECFVFLSLDKRFKLISKHFFKSDSNAHVRTDVPEILTAISVHKPSFVVIAHNHPSGNALPSQEDIYSTKKLCLLCDINDVVLIDHVIFAGEQSFSFKSEGLLEKLSKNLSLEKLFDAVKDDTII